MGTRGGIAQFNAQLARTLQSGGADVAILGYRRIYPRFARAGRQGADPSRRLESVESKAIIVPWLPWTWFIAFGRSDIGPGDLLIIQWWHPITAVCSWYLARRSRSRGASVVFVCHNAVPHESFPMARSLSRRALRQASQLIALSQPVASQLQGLRPAVDVRVIPHPSYAVLDADPATLTAGELNWRRRLRLEDASKVVLFFGNVRPYKGLTDLVDAFPAVRDETGASLVVVGTFFESLDAYREKVRELGLDDCVRLVDEYVPNEDVAPLFALADLIALPYRSASQSGVLPIAACLGKPVVATEVGGLPEALAGTGLLVPPSDPEALGRALSAALRHPPPPPPVADASWEAWADAFSADGDARGRGLSD